MRWMTAETVIWTVNKKAYIVFLLLGIVSIGAKAQQGMNRPYVDDKIIHFGFQIGLNFSTFHVTDSELPIVNPITGETEIYHARVSTLMPGFHVGFVSDVRMCKYLNLRFCPGLLFTNRTISYKTESGHPVRGLAGKHGSTVDVLAMPVYLPLYLKFSASREGNYRPYVIAGGGVSFNVSRDREKPILLNLMDYFCEVGFGVDLYFRWFKFCPEITYRIGFANQLSPSAGRIELAPQDVFYTDALSRLTSHSICLTFNFE